MKHSEGDSHVKRSDAMALLELPCREKMPKFMFALGLGSVQVLGFGVSMRQASNRKGRGVFRV